MVLILLFCAFLIGLAVIAGLLLRKQNQLYKYAAGPPDLVRADDAELAPPLDPHAPSDAAEDGFASRPRPPWFWGSKDDIR